jgi:hypothetical protein
MEMSSPHVSNPHVSGPHVSSPHVSGPHCCTSFVLQNSEYVAVGFKPITREIVWYVARIVGGEA